MDAEKLNFGTDVSRLLDIVANALYSHQDVFLRELVSNAADACDKLRYEAISTPDLIRDAPAFQIRITADTDSRLLCVADNGIGMNREDLTENLGTIARSGTAAMMESVNAAQAAQDSGASSESLKLIGQFGVGFYASFMVAESVDVISRKAGDDKAWHWRSDGRTGYEIREAAPDEAARLPDGRGTLVALTIKASACDFLIEDKIRQVVQRYSDHISFPVFIGAPQDHDDERPANSAGALWARPKSGITADQYDQFYKHISHGFDDPLKTIHWRAEGKIEFTSLLFIPTMRPWDMFDPGRKSAVRLYVRRVFITDECGGLIYPWLRFLRGVIDTEDLPLNISRESLQDNPLIAKIRSSVAKKVLGALHKLSEDDNEAFATFWEQFGPVLKEGLYDAYELREALFKVVRFRSTHDDGKTLVSLAEYKSRMKDDQKAIYYISGENPETLKNSPQLEGFRDQGIEVLFMTDTIDDFWIQNVGEFDDTPLRSVTRGDADLGSVEAGDGADAKDAAKNDNTGEDKDAPETPLSGLLRFMEDLLKDDVSAVRESKRLRSSPVCMVADDGAVDMHMERVLKIHQHYTPERKRVLEVNPDHPLLRHMAERFAAEGESADCEDVKDCALMLMDQARIIQGEPVTDPAAFSRRMSRFMEKGLVA